MLRKNIFANYIGAASVALASIIALPWYLAALGTQQFGLVSFIMLLQGLLGMLDAGMGQALVREFSLRYHQNSAQCTVAPLLLVFERIYWLFAWAIAGLTACSAEFLTTHWLNLGDLPKSIAHQAIYAAAALFALQFPGSVYRSLLVGSQAQIKLNGIVTGSTLLRHAGGVMIIQFWPTLHAYLLWQITVSLTETLIRSQAAWGVLHVKRHQFRWKTEELTQTWRLVVGLSGATWLGALTVQIDKIILSRMVDIEQFGYYSIATSVSFGVLQLIYPLTQAILPRAVQLRDRPIDLFRLHRKLLTMILLMVVVGTIGFATLGPWLLVAWLRNDETATAVYPLLVVLLIGTSLNAFYNVGYIYWLVHENIRRILQVNALSLMLSIALIPVLVSWQGTIGAAFGWLTINSVGLILSLEWMTNHQRLKSSTGM